MGLQNINIKSMEGRMKKNEGKPQLSLMYTSFMIEVCRVREYGIEKHGSPDGWKSTTPIEHIDATLRHIMAFKSWLLKESTGEEYDLESGFRHLAHAGCNIMFEIERSNIIPGIIPADNGLGGIVNE